MAGAVDECTHGACGMSPSRKPGKLPVPVGLKASSGLLFINR
jgi:hypothetical protein